MNLQSRKVDKYIYIANFIDWKIKIDQMTFNETTIDQKTTIDLSNYTAKYILLQLTEIEIRETLVNLIN